MGGVVLFGRRRKPENKVVRDWYIEANTMSVAAERVLPTAGGDQLNVVMQFHQFNQKSKRLFRVLIEEVAPENAAEILGGENGKD
jgi:hypothetical protein